MRWHRTPQVLAPEIPLRFAYASDLHLGQNGSDQKGQYSLLSRVPASLPDEKKAADAMQARLCAVVKKFAQGQDVTLIVAGDLLDLSLAYPIWSAPWSIA